MHPFTNLARRAVSLAAFATLTALSSAAHALVTYTYTGPALNSFTTGDPTHPVSADGLVASFVFEDFLPPNLGATYDFQLVTPLSWNITGGGYSLGINDAHAAVKSPHGYGMGVYTDASGVLLGWHFQADVFDGNNTVGPVFVSKFYPTGFNSSSTPAEKLDGVWYFNQPSGFSFGENASLVGGSWTVSSAPVPEPATATLLLAGAGLLGWLARRRVRC